MILVLAIIVTVSGMSLAYAEGGNNIDSNKFNGQDSGVKSLSDYRGNMMSLMGDGVQSDDDMNKMIELMKENGFTDEANAMKNRDFNTMKNLMAN